MPDSLSALIGHWQMVRAEFAGEAAPELVVQRTELHFSADRYRVSYDSEERDAGTYVIAGDAATKTLTLLADAGANTGRRVECIFQLVGDRLRICYGLDGKLPTHFTTGLAQPRYLATYRRVPE